MTTATAVVAQVKKSTEGEATDRPKVDSNQALAASGYRVVSRFDVGGEGDWDFLTIDSDARRLYVSHDAQVEVLDADSGKLVGRIRDTPGVASIAIASDLHLGFTSNGGNKTVTVFDSNTLLPIKKVQLQSGADFVLYDSFSKRVFPLNQKTTVLDAVTGNVVGMLDLDGRPETAASNGKGTIYVNLFDKGVVAAVDVKTLSVTKRYPVKCRSPHSLSYDAAHERLLIGCRDSFIALDASTGTLMGETVICQGVDAGGFDEENKLIFEACDEGVVSVIRQITPDYYALVDSIPTQLWARTMTFDPKTKNLYLATADYEIFPNADPNYPYPFQAKIKPGSFRVLVLGKR